MGTRRDLIEIIKQTRIGCAAAWLIKPKKHYRDIARFLECQLPYPPNKKQIIWCFWDYLRFCFRYRGDLQTDYFGAQLYRKSDLVRQESMAHAVRFAWRDAVQDRQYWHIFLDKRHFYTAFSSHLHRRWMIVDQNTTWDVFCRFVSTCSNRLFAKNPTGQGGKGVSYWCLENEEEKHALFAQCQTTPMVLEEVLTQCEELQSFSNGPVNTLRVITIIDLHGDVHVARCELRMGRSGTSTDNYCSGGLVAQVDVDTGVVFTMGKDANGREYIFHPDSGKQIVGYAIPDWDAYSEFVRVLANKYPAMRYVGWDIIKDSKGNFCVIEGNKDAGVGGLESSLLYGLKPYYDAFLEGHKSFPHSEAR